MYAVISETEYYGPCTEVTVHAFCATKTTADGYADEKNNANGPIWLSHNQASSSIYIVRRVPSEDRCGRGYDGAPMWRGHYLPSATELAQSGLIEV